MNKPESVRMLRRLYAVRDDKQCEFNAPCSMPNDAVASRAFGDVLSDANHPVSRHAADYSIWYIGSYDAESGELVADVPPYIVARAADFKEVSNG